MEHLLGTNISASQTQESLLGGFVRTPLLGSLPRAQGLGIYIYNKHPGEAHTA